MARRTEPLPRALELWLVGVGKDRRRGTREPEDRKDQVCRAQEDATQVGTLRPGPGVSWARGECGKGPSELIGSDEWTPGRGVWECGQGGFNRHFRAGGLGERGKTYLCQFPSNKCVITPQLVGKVHPLGPCPGLKPSPTAHQPWKWLPAEWPCVLGEPPWHRVTAAPVYHHSILVVGT